MLKLSCRSLQDEFHLFQKNNDKLQTLERGKKEEITFVSFSNFTRMNIHEAFSASFHLNPLDLMTSVGRRGLLPVPHELEYE